MLDDTIRSALRMTGLPGEAADISTRIAQGCDHFGSTGRTGGSPRAMSARCHLVTIHHVTAPGSERTNPAKSTAWPSPATNFAATQYDSQAIRLLDRDDRPAMKGM
ncbi:hypothetical protein [Nocardia nepalensis]|uniref:hypothetical protein n=1 Tax=Nocardia nepalensis TaxID=3375448 RepID=UPI003B678B72